MFVCVFLCESVCVFVVPSTQAPPAGWLSARAHVQRDWRRSGGIHGAGRPAAPGSARAAVVERRHQRWEKPTLTGIQMNMCV